jgi:protocatechuate 3,4-dioxygenase beta subunit
MQAMGRVTLAVGGAVLLLAAAIGCGSAGEGFGGGGGADPVTSITTSSRLNDQGGSVEDADTGAKITVAQGSLNAPLTVQVGATSDPGIPTDRAERLIGSSGYYFGPDGLLFNEPATIELPYEDFDIPSKAIQDALQVYCLHDDVWLRVAGHEVVSDANVVRVRVDRLSTFVMATALQFSRVNWSAIQGTVTDSSGQPVAGATVELPQARLYTVTDDEGKYLLDTIGAGGYPIRATKPGYRIDDARADVTLGKTATVDFQLIADNALPGNLKVLVTSDQEATEPVEGAIVAVSEGPSQPDAGETDASGQVEFEELLPGTYSVTVTAEGLTDRTYGGVTIGSGEWTVLGAALTGTASGEPGSLTGFVRDATGAAIAGARVEVEAGPHDVGRSTLSDASGVYTLDQLPEGNYSFLASAEGFDSKSTGPIQIDGGEQTSYTFVLLPVGTGEVGSIAGQVVDEDGQPLQGVSVSMIQAPADLLDTTTDAEGKYEFTLLQPGTYSLRFSLQGYEPATADNQTVEGGKVTTINRRLFPASG